MLVTGLKEITKFVLEDFAAKSLETNRIALNTVEKLIKVKERARRDFKQQGRKGDKNPNKDRSEPPREVTGSLPRARTKRRSARPNLGKPHHKKKRKSSDNVTRGGPPASASDSLGVRS